MSERYCPECKQNVEVHDVDVLDTCFNCDYEFGVVADKAELEELVELFEVLIALVDGLARRIGVPTNQERAIKTAAKFREKYLAK